MNNNQGDGEYFSRLSFDVDYRLKASYRGADGPAKTLSEFDSSDAKVISRFVRNQTIGSRRCESVSTEEQHRTKTLTERILQCVTCRSVLALREFPQFEDVLPTWESPSSPML